jgi:hypothetical protein
MKTQQPTQQLGETEDGAGIEQGVKRTHGAPTVKENESENSGRDAEAEKQNQQEIKDE